MQWKNFISIKFKLNDDEKALAYQKQYKYADNKKKKLLENKIIRLLKRKKLYGLAQEKSLRFVSKNFNDLYNKIKLANLNGKTLTLLQDSIQTRYQLLLNLEKNRKPF